MLPFITSDLKLHPTSNQSLEPTADRRTTSLHFMKIPPLQATLALASGD